MIELVLLYQVWIIVGIVFILLELTDGSAIFFLPLGLGSFSQSLYLFSVNKEIISPSLVIEKWYFLIVMWACISLVFSFLISNIWKKNINEDDDVNNY